MTEHAPDRLWSGIQISKVVAGTLAAVSAAVLGSFLGVAGTLAGAALASIVGSVGTEVYQRSLDRGAKKLQTLAPTFIKAPAAVGTPEVAAATDDDSPSHTVPEVLKEETPAASPVPSPGRSAVNWKRVGLAAVAVFILAMIPLTIVEMASGRTLANLVGSSQATGTSLGTAVTGNEDKTPATTPTTEPSETPADDATMTPATDETSGPVETPATTDPATEPTTAPTTGAPTTDAPQETTPADPPPDEQQPDERSDVEDPQQGNE
jgi:hypothetical protein